MDFINDFLNEFGNIIFEEHLSFLRAFKTDYENFDDKIPCSHDDNSNEDVVGMCTCYFFHMKKQRVMKIIEKYRSLFHHFLSTATVNRKED